MNDNDSVLFPLEIRTREGFNVTVRQGIAEKLNKGIAIPGFYSLNASDDFGHIGFQYFFGNGFTIWYSQYDITRPVELFCTGDVGMLELSIPITANIYSSWDNLNPELVQDEQFELAYIPFVHNRTNFRKPGTCRTFDIHYSREYLDRFVGDYPVIGHFLERVDKGEPVSLTGRSRFLTPRMGNLLRDMLAFNMSDKLSGYFYEGSILLMVTMVLDRLEMDAGKKPARYSSHEIAIVAEVKNIMVADFSAKYSIRELARKTGTSETKLQRSFKDLCGATIFDYAQTARLNFAKVLLLDTDNTIQSISEQCGYPDNSNFSAAFRKRHGCSPETFRAKGK